MIDKKRLKKMRLALYGPAEGRTTAALAEALERLMDPDHAPMLFFVVAGESIGIAVAMDCAIEVADALNVFVEKESGRVLHVGPERRELRFVTAWQFLYGPEILGRQWGGRSPSFLADPAVLGALWCVRKMKP